MFWVRIKLKYFLILCLFNIVYFRGEGVKGWVKNSDKNLGNISPRSLSVTMDVMFDTNRLINVYIFQL